MTRTVLLRTRCGCERYLQWNHFTRYIEVPISPNLSSNWDSLPKIEDTLRRRRFRIDGCTADGIYIFTEVLE